MRSLIFVVIMLSASFVYSATVAVIDMEKVVQATPAGKSAKKKIEAEYAKNKTRFEKKEKAIDAEAKAYEKKKNSYSAEMQRSKEKELGEKMAAFEKEIQDSEKAIQEMSQKLTKPIIDKIQKAVADISKAKGYAVVLERKTSNVFYASDTADISDQVIKAVTR